MPDNMDLNTFYTHALQWKHQADETERLAEEENKRRIHSSWEDIAKLIRTAFPVEGMSILETEEGMFAQLPNFIGFFHLDLVFTPEIKEKVMNGSGTLMEGVVRVCIHFDDVSGSWQLVKFYAIHGSETKEFDNPYGAFLVAAPNLGINIYQSG